MELQIDKTALAAYFADQPNVVAAYLFGSVARERAHARSDVDIAVLLREGMGPLERGEYLLRLINALWGLCGRQVDVVILNQAPPVLQNQVLKYGHLLYERDRAKRVAFEVRARTIYLDLKPMREFYRRALFEEVKEVGLGRRGRYPRTPAVAEGLR